MGADSHQALPRTVGEGAQQAPSDDARITTLGNGQTLALTEGDLEAALDALPETSPKVWKKAPEDSNPSRRRAQGARPSSGQVLEDGSVLRKAAVPSMIPEGKRCEALTVRGSRCKAAKLRGLRVCMFHGHLAGDDERLAALADPSPEASSPTLKPRQALRAVAQLRAGEMAVAAVSGALSSANRDGGRAVLSILDAVDPLAEQSAELLLSEAEIMAAPLSRLLLLKQRRGLVQAAPEPQHTHEGT